MPISLNKKHPLTVWGQALVLGFLLTMAWPSGSARATSFRHYEAACGYCGQSSSQRSLGGSSMFPDLELDFQPAQVIFINLQVKECPHCGYLTAGNFSKPAPPGVRLVMESRAFKGLSVAPESEDDHETVMRRFRRLVLLEEAAGDDLHAGIDSAVIAWLLEPGWVLYKRELEKFDQANGAVYEEFSARKEALERDQEQAREAAQDNGLSDSEQESLENVQEKRREELHAAWEAEEGAALLELRHNLMEPAPAPLREQAAEMRLEAIRLLEKARLSFDFKKAANGDQAEEQLIGLFLLMEMYRRTSAFDRAAALIPVTGQALADLGDILYEDNRERYSLHLRREEELIGQKDDRRRILSLSRW